MISRLPLLSALVASLFCSASAGDKFPKVEAPPVRASKRPSSFALHWENDIAAQTDGNYTNGVRMAWLSGDRVYGELPLWAAWLAKPLPGAASVSSVQYGVSLTQQIYSPRDIKATSLTPDDRPYAGWLGLGFSAHAREGNRVSSLELSLGVVGPSSFAEDLQRAAHDVTGASQPQGWDNQLGDEVTLNLYHTTRWVFRGDESRRRAWDWALSPQVGFSLGNALTDLNGGALFVFGYQLPGDFLAPKLVPGLYSDQDCSDGDFSAYSFLGVDGRVVFHNVLLDGNTFRDSHSVDKETFVGEIYGGLGMRRRDWTLTYTQTLRGPEFTEQDGAQSFGSLSIGLSF